MILLILPCRESLEAGKIEIARSAPAPAPPPFKLEALPIFAPGRPQPSFEDDVAELVRFAVFQVAFVSL